MKRLLLLICLVLAISARAQTTHNHQIKQTKHGTLLKFKADPKAGYNFDYLLYLPAKLQQGTTTYLMVETNNTGKLNDTIAVHEQAAIHAASEGGVALYVAEKLGLPLLVPIFPRPASDWQLYTHALDRDTFLTKDEQLQRLDLQLIAMINAARKELAARQYQVKEQIFITGFSASGTFANRFSLLHPHMVKATASGGINAIPILPVCRLEGKRLEYPLGVADIKKETGSKADIAAFAKVPKLLYMGELDDNDAVAFDDAYSAEERQLVYDLMGKYLPERWAFVQKVYKDEGIEADFRTYNGIGHGTDRKINNDLVEFFRKYLD